MIRLVKSTFYREKETKEKLVNFITHAKQLSFKNECEKFEKDFAKWQKRKYCIFVNSGSSANLCVIQTLLNLGKIKKGDYVGFSALTWSTNAMPLIQLGLNAVPIDIELSTLNVSSRKLLDTLQNHPLKMVLLTNLLGFCDDIDMIKTVCQERKIVFVEDSCESLGTIYKGKLLGNYGLASTFSFYVGHHMSTIEGGAICTDDEKIATMLRLVRAHGWDRNLNERKRHEMQKKFRVNSSFYSRYTFYDLGFNLRPTEINGFIGNVQLTYLNEIIKKRRDNFYKLAQAIYKRHDIYFPIRFDHIHFLSNFAVPVICRTQKIRDMLVEKCKNTIEIRPVVGGNISAQPFFKKYMSEFTKILKNSNAQLIHRQGLYFGNNPELTNKEMNKIIQIFTNI